MNRTPIERTPAVEETAEETQVDDTRKDPGPELPGDEINELSPGDMFELPSMQISMDNVEDQCSEVLSTLAVVSMDLTATWREFLEAKRVLEKYEAEQHIKLVVDLRQDSKGKWISDKEIDRRIRLEDRHTELLVNMQIIQYRMNRLQAIKDLLVHKKDFLLGLVKQDT